MYDFKSDYLPLVARILLSILFLYSGLGKAINPEGTISYITAAGLPAPSLAYASAVAIELLLGTALLIGYKLTIAGSVLAGYSIAAAIIFHSNFSERIQLISFLKNVAICGGLLQLIITPPGGLSADGYRKSHKA